MIEKEHEALRQLEEIINKEIREVEESKIWNSDYSPSFHRDGDGVITLLNLEKCNISDLSPLSSLIRLTRLDLGGNRITDLSPLSKLTRLTTLGLDGNRITNITPLAKLTGLERLWLFNNEITDLSPLSKLTRLTTLGLDGNRITNISPLAQLTGLTHLWIQNNRITNLSPLLPLIEINLKNIFLDGNPLESPPIEIAQQGPIAILSYFEQLKLNEAPKPVLLLQCKLLIIGSGEVGKTTLMKKLKNPTIPIQKDEPTTPGIHIEPWEIPCKFENCGENRTVKVFFWDFGGQEIYHATHQFFLTKRSLYILVWEARKEEESNSFNYWLNVVKLLGTQSPIIVVMNKSDIRTKPIDQLALQTKFPQIKGFANVSCLESTGLNELTRLITKTLEQMPHLQDLLPASWLHIRDTLKAMNENYISASEFFQICNTHNIKEKDANIIADYLHDLGVILYFRNDPLLSDTVILKPEWATTAVYNLLDANEIILNNGSFLFNDLKRYWNPVLYPVAKHTMLVRLMEKFELCFQFLNTDKYFIPELIPGESIAFDTSVYDHSSVLHFQYKYDFMPEGILSRFISRLYYLIKNNNFRKYIVELEFDDSSALIKSDPLNSCIHIRISGEDKSELKAIIRSHFRHIHETLNMKADTHYKEMVPCNCETCTKSLKEKEPFYFSYENLIKFKNSGINQYPCEKSVGMIDINSLLKGFQPVIQGRLSKEILSGIVYVSTKVMGLSKSMKPDEDSRTGLLCLLLNERGFEVKDQTRWGSSASGKSIGRPDAIIITEDGEEAVLEAFMLSGFNANVIESHCIKIFKYDPVGFNNNFMVVYCDVKGNEFANLWEKYKNLVNGISYDYPIIGELSEEPVQYSDIKIAHAIHKRQGKEVSIYHLFLHMQ